MKHMIHNCCHQRQRQHHRQAIAMMPMALLLITLISTSAIVGAVTSKAPTIAVAPTATVTAASTSPSPTPNEVIITEWPLHDINDAHARVTDEYTSEAIRSGGNGNGKAQTLSNPILSKLRDYQLVRPQSLISNEAIVEQLAPGDHPETLSYRIQAFGKDFDITLNKNNDLFTSDYQQIRLAYDPKDLSAPPRVERTQAVHCYYQGSVAGDSNSVVTMNTCNGLQGSVRGHGEYFALEPASFASSLPTASSGMSTQSTSAGAGIGSRESSIGFSPSSLPTQNAHPLHHAFPLSRIPTTDHLVYRHSDLQEEEKTCGLLSGDTSGSANSNPTGNGRNDDATAAGTSATNGISAAIPATTTNTAAFSEAPIDGASSASQTAAGGSTPAASTAPTPSPGSGGRETIELLIFNDNQRWRNKGESTEANSLAILNEMKQFYSSTVFDRVVNVKLVGQVTFSQGDPYQADMTDSGVAVEGAQGLLQVFHRYRNAAANVLPHHDNGQLFSERRFTSNIMGLAGVGSMCSEQSGSITCMTSDSITKNAMISAHETGHTLSMMHDGVYNNCPSGGYIMQTTTGTATTFSTCSVTSADNFLPSASCLYNYAARQASIKEAPKGEWLANSWSDCSATCGAGIQVRTIDCRDTSGKILAAKDCNEFLKPLSVRICNATLACDSCAMVNCSGIGVCRNGKCLCPEGTTGRHCEINMSKSSRSDTVAHSDDQSTSTMALVITATITGVALACATLLWICRVIQRHAKDRSMRHSMLASSKSHSDFSSSPSSDFISAPAPTPVSSDHMNGNGSNGTPVSAIHSGSMNDAAHAAAAGNGNGGVTLHSGVGVPAGLHKTPRSVPRSIAVKS